MVIAKKISPSPTIILFNILLFNKLIEIFIKNWSTKNDNVDKRSILKDLGFSHKNESNSNRFLQFLLGWNINLSILQTNQQTLNLHF